MEEIARKYLLPRNEREAGLQGRKNNCAIKKTHSFPLKCVEIWNGFNEELVGGAYIYEAKPDVSLQGCTNVAHFLYATKR